MFNRLIASLCTVAMSATFGHAAQINLIGDLGPNAWTGALFSPVNTFTTTSFTHVLPGVGSITGDVFSNNTAGASFSLRITNLTFTVLSPAQPSGLTEIELIAMHNYQTAGPGAYNSSHQLVGSWTTAAGNAAQLDTLLDVSAGNISLPTLAGLNTAQSPTFNFGGPGIGSTTASAVFTIQSTLRLRLDGAGNIFLPSSADVDVLYVPAASPLLAFVAVGAAARRRR